MKRVILSLIGCALVICIWFITAHYVAPRVTDTTVQAIAPSGGSKTYVLNIVCDAETDRIFIENETEDRAIFNCADGNLVKLESKTAELNKAELNIVDLRSAIQAKEKGHDIIAPFCSKHPWYEGCN